jgi:hypothetical protein
MTGIGEMFAMSSTVFLGQGMDDECKPVDASRFSGGIDNSRADSLFTDDLQELIAGQFPLFLAKGDHDHGLKHIDLDDSLQDLGRRIDDHIHAALFQEVDAIVIGRRRNDDFTPKLFECARIQILIETLIGNDNHSGLLHGLAQDVFVPFIQQRH